MVTLEKSVTMDTKIAHIIFLFFILSEALCNPILSPVIYFLLSFLSFLCVYPFVCVPADSLAGAALIGLPFPFSSVSFQEY